MGKKILAINPGSTSTKVSYFDDAICLHTMTISHDSKDLEQFKKITDQFDYRKQTILDWLASLGLESDKLDGVVGRGGLLRPMPSGTYTVTQQMQKDLIAGIQGEHASNLGGLIARALADEQGVEAYIVDPVAVDEFHEVARISGLKEIKRVSLVHALNVRATSLRYAKEIGKRFEELNLIVAHLGGGISVVAIKQGKMIDTNDANEMGPFSPERTGSLPVWEMARMIFDGRFKDWNECKTWLRGKGGVVAYLGTNDMRVVEKMIGEGDEKARQIAEAMAYQIGKEIGSCAGVLSGKVDAILLTGGVAHNKRITDYVTEMTQWIAPLKVYPGEDEMQSLAEGALRVLNGEESAKNYDKEARFD